MKKWVLHFTHHVCSCECPVILRLAYTLLAYEKVCPLNTPTLHPDVTRALKKFHNRRNSHLKYVVCSTFFTSSAVRNVVNSTLLIQKAGFYSQHCKQSVVGDVF